MNYVCSMQKERAFDKDYSLYLAIRNGDEKAFDTFFLKYYPMLCAYARQYVGLEDAQEVVQDVMVWFWENREMQVFDTSVSSYLFKSVKNKCLTLISRNEMKQHISSVLLETGSSLYEDPDYYIVEELSQKIDAAVAALPDSYREVFEMNRFQRMTYQEIADQINLSPKTVDYRIQQSLKILRAELKDYLPLLLLLY